MGLCGDTTLSSESPIQEKAHERKRFMTVPTAVQTRSCPYCTAEMMGLPNTLCGSCGWTYGSMPVAQFRDSQGELVTQFVQEPRIGKGRTIIVLLTFGGAFTVLLGLGQNFGAVLIGLLLTTLGISVWRITGFGRIMYGLTPGQKVYVKIVIGLGTVVLWLTVIGILVGIFAPERIRRSL